MAPGGTGEWVAPEPGRSGPGSVAGAGRWCDEERFVGSAALGCRNVPSGAGKMEIPINILFQDESKGHAHRDDADPSEVLTDGRR